MNTYNYVLAEMIVCACEFVGENLKKWFSCMTEHNNIIVSTKYTDKFVTQLET